MPSLPIHVCADQYCLDRLKGVYPLMSFSLIDNPHRRSKIDYLNSSPFPYTLYVDTDVRCVANISSIFSILDRFDIALAHAHSREKQETQRIWLTDIPESYPQFNGGIILYKRTSLVSQLLMDWGKSHHSSGLLKDQVTLRELLWLSDLRIATLPPEYNVRYKKYLMFWKKSECNPKLLHFASYHRKTSLAEYLTNPLLFLKHFRTDWGF